MGRLFQSFDESWRSFLGRSEELEDFFARFPTEETYVTVWLLPAAGSVVSGVRPVQQALAGLDWITPQPEHFLHVTVAVAGEPGPRPAASELEAAKRCAAAAWAGIDPFEIGFRRINCFHESVVVEVEGAGPALLAGRLAETAGTPSAPYLPHLTIGLVNRPHPPHALRDALLPLRDLELGAMRVQEVALCVVPASRTTVLDPWEVVAIVELG